MSLDQSVTTSLQKSVMHLGPTPQDRMALVSDEALELMATLQRMFVRQILTLRASAPRSARTASPPASWNGSLRSLLALDEQVQVDGLAVSAGIFDLTIHLIASQVTLNRGAGPLSATLTAPTSRAEAELWGAIVAATHRILELAPDSLRLRPRQTPRKSARALETTLDLSQSDAAMRRFA